MLFFLSADWLTYSTSNESMTMWSVYFTYNVVYDDLQVESVDEILKCDHSMETIE